MSLFQTFFMGNKPFAESDVPIISLLYTRLPIEDDFRPRLPQIPLIEGEGHEPELEVESWWDANRSLLAQISWGKHTVEIGGIAAPVPEVARDRCIWSSAWRADLKELLDSHRANVIFRYAGEHTDPIEQYIALYKAASIFPRDSLVGVLNEPAWCSHPPDLLHNIVHPEMLPVVRESPPLLYWTGFLRTAIEEIDFCFSRGHHLFGVTDFATVLPSPEEALASQQLFHELFQYAYFEDKPLTAGDLIQIDEHRYYEFFPLDQGMEALEGLGSTLIVHPLSPDEYEERADSPAS